MISRMNEHTINYNDEKCSKLSKVNEIIIIVGSHHYSHHHHHNDECFFFLLKTFVLDCVCDQSDNFH